MCVSHFSCWLREAGRGTEGLRSLSVLRMVLSVRLSEPILILPCDPNERFLSFLVEPVLLN